MTTFTKQLRSTAGYTIDQMILVIAIIAILVTLVIVSVGWNLINRTSGAKLAAQFKQVEDANGGFYSTFRVWPHQSYTAPAATTALNVVALSGGGTGITTWSNAVQDSPAQGKNFIPGFRNDGANVTHNFSNAANNITMGANTTANPWGNRGAIGSYLIVRFTSVPMAEVMEAEIAIDGPEVATSYSTGRVVASTVIATDCTTGAAVASAAVPATNRGALVTVCYLANALN